jgi:hypothetical protein
MATTTAIPSMMMHNNSNRTYSLFLASRHAILNSQAKLSFEVLSGVFKLLVVRAFVKI